MPGLSSITFAGEGLRLIRLALVPEHQSGSLPTGSITCLSICSMHLCITWNLGWQVVSC